MGTTMSDYKVKYGNDVRTVIDKYGRVYLNFEPGNQYFVNSATGSSAKDGKTWGNALNTVKNALAKVTASNGDVIWVAPGHAETISSATSMALNKAGVTIIGLGYGAMRPTFTFSETASNIPISAASVWLENILCVANVDQIVAGITISAADCTLKNVEWRDVTDKEAILSILTTSAADRLTIDGFYHNGFVTGDACTDAIRLVGVDTGFITNSKFLGNYGTAIIEFHTTACTKILIDNCLFCETGTSNYTKNVVDTVTGSTWYCNAYDLVAGKAIGGGSGAALSAVDVTSVSSALSTLQAEISGAAGLTSFPASAAPANGVSLAEAIRDIWDVLRNGTGGSEPGTNRSIIDCIRGGAINYNNTSYLAVSADLSNVTWNTQASHEVFTVTGAVRMRIMIECTSTLTDAGNGGTVQMGVEGATNAWIASSDSDNVVAGSVWADNTPGDTNGNFSSLLLDKIVAGGLDVGYEIGGEALTGGTLVFHCWWEPLNATGAVAAGAGGAL
jgi:hypothetical protein